MTYPTLEAFAQRYLGDPGARDITPAQLLEEAWLFIPPGFDYDFIEQDLATVVEDDGGDVQKFINTVMIEGDIFDAGGSSVTDAFIGHLAELSGR